MRIAPAIFVLTGIALTACGSLDHGQASRDQVDDHALAEVFSFRSRVQISGRDTNDPAVEVMRIKDLERDLRANRKCPKGYVITSRRTVIQAGEKDHVDYFGQCLA